MRQNLYNHLITKNSKLVKKRMSYIRQGHNWQDIPNEYKTKGKHSNLYKRFAVDKPSPTLSNIRKSVFIHPLEDRGISVREGARLQSFRDEFRFCGSLSSQQQQIGNAVPPLLACNIAKHIRELLLI